jgi:hypothetical protein
LTNLLIFGLWYWETDRGGPRKRAAGHDGAPDFLFPQMTDDRIEPLYWRPQFIDYLYVSLTNATAFSPTDTLPLTPSVKSLMGLQSLVSLVTDRADHLPRRQHPPVVLETLHSKASHPRWLLRAPARRPGGRDSQDATLLTLAAVRRSLARALWPVAYLHWLLRVCDGADCPRAALGMRGGDLSVLWPRGAERCVLRSLWVAACWRYPR